MVVSVYSACHKILKLFQFAQWSIQIVSFGSWRFFGGQNINKFFWLFLLSVELWFVFSSESDNLRSACAPRCMSLLMSFLLLWFRIRWKYWASNNINSILKKRVDCQNISLHLFFLWNPRWTTERKWIKYFSFFPNFESHCLRSPAYYSTTTVPF